MQNELHLISISLNLNWIKNNNLETYSFLDLEENFNIKLHSILMEDIFINTTSPTYGNVVNLKIC